MKVFQFYLIHLSGFGISGDKPAAKSSLQDQDKQDKFHSNTFYCEVF